MAEGIGVGVIGFGTVGTGTIRILQENADIIQRRLGVPLNLVQVADADLMRDRGIHLEPDLLTSDAQALLDNPAVDIVVELVGGFEPARTFILDAIQRGKHVVTANKALLAHHGEEIFSAALAAGVEVGFEASVGGGIPILDVVKTGLGANRILAIYGIINGTANYILSNMTQDGKTFQEALAEAQSLGYAEADPTLDVEGGDSAHKLTILASLAFGTPMNVDDIYVEGITHVTPLDIEFAREFGYTIKLLGITKQGDEEIEARVHPTMIPTSYLLADVNESYNAVYVEGDRVGSTLFYGRGAGAMPTGSAVVADLMDIARNIRTGAVGRVPLMGFDPHERRRLRLKPIEEIHCRYYFRFTVVDRPGVLSHISGILGNHRISIASVIQKGRREGEAVPVVITTHEALEKDVRDAMLEIDRTPVVREPTVLIRVEGGG